jgi:hypothetical protein
MENNIEKVKVLTLNDLIIGEKKESGRSIHYVDSIKLEEALTLGQIRHIDIFPNGDCLSITTLIDKEKQKIETGEDRFGKLGEEGIARVHKKVETYEAMLQARPEYIQLNDNISFNIYSEKQNRAKLAEDFVEWLIERGAIISSKENISTQNPEALVDKLCDTTEPGQSIAQIDVSLDYPALTHGMKLNGSRDNLGGLDVSLLFYSWASPVEGKIACNADLLSAVKVANFFKRKGYDIELALTQNAEYIAK